MKQQLKKLALHLNSIGYEKESLVAAKLFKRAQEEGIPDMSLDTDMGVEDDFENNSDEGKEDVAASFAGTLSQGFEFESYEEKEAFLEEVKQIAIKTDASEEFLQEMTYFLEAFLEL